VSVRAHVAVGALVGLGLALGPGGRLAAAPAPPVADAGAASLTPAAALRDARAAATAGDWPRVTALIGPLLAPPGAAGAHDPALAGPDLAEAHRLLGLAAFFDDRATEADAELLAYLRLELDGRLDPALYPPEAVTFFEAVRARHAAELRARRPASRSRWINLLPPLGQLQNGDRGRGIMLGASLGALLVANVSTYLVLRSWCGGVGATCDKGGVDHTASAAPLRGVNVATGVAFLALFGYGIYDGLRGYHQRTLELEVAATGGGAVVGVGGRF
jgi:hypothetical protein